MPVPTPAFIDPFCKRHHADDDLQHPGPAHQAKTTRRDPRNVARKAVNYMKSTGIADTAYFGPELEFFVFDDVRYDQNPALRLLLPRQRRRRLEHAAATRSRTSATSSATRKATSPCPPSDALQDIRTEMMLTMIECGLDVEAQHHEVATGGQGEIDMQFAAARRDGRQRDASTSTSSRTSPRSTARRPRSCPSRCSGTTAPACTSTSRCGRTARTCSPARGYAGLSEMGMYAIGGLLKHAPALCAFTNPTTNSYKRLVPGYEAPVNLAYSRRNRSASIRIPVYSPSPKAKRIEFRCPDGSSNPVPGLLRHADGDARRHQEQDQSRRAARQGHLRSGAGRTGQGAQDAGLAGRSARTTWRRITSSCCTATSSPSDVISTWIWYKREKEVDAIRLRPHPYEFCLYYDI